MPGPDHKASLEPLELNSMVNQIRQLEVALGDGVKRPQASEWNTRQAARQQLLVAEPVMRGEKFSRSSLVSARCGRGISPMNLWDWVGEVADRDYLPGDVLKA